MKKILIIDDDPINTHILRWMLRGNELELVTSSSHRGIEQLLDQLRPDLLIMDIQLDGANGCEICSSLKKDARYSTLPILLTSSNSDYYDRECMAEGFIPKPYSTRELNGIISSVL